MSRRARRWLLAAVLLLMCLVCTMVLRLPSQEARTPELVHRPISGTCRVEVDGDLTGFAGFVLQTASLIHRCRLLANARQADYLCNADGCRMLGNARQAAGDTRQLQITWKGPCPFCISDSKDNFGHFFRPESTLTKVNPTRLTVVH